MRRTFCSSIAAILIAIASFSNPSPAATDPTLSSWLQNTTNQTGHSTVSSINSVVSQIPANVQQVRYTDTNVYVNATGIPSYNVGPFGNDPNVPSNQNRLIDIPRNPTPQSGAHTATGLGPIGVFVNGVALYNAKDANSYNNQNVWHSNAVVVEAGDMDSALGHPDQSGSYHHHQQPISLISQLGGDSSHFSPLLGYAFDGYPIYGPYAYANPDGTGGIVRVTSSYGLRNITQRTTLSDGTVLSPSQYGPAVSSQYPLGYYVEDYQYVAGSGMLDQYNGRFTVTPDYPPGHLRLLRHHRLPRQLRLPLHRRSPILRRRLPGRPHSLRLRPRQRHHVRPGTRHRRSDFGEPFTLRSPPQAISRS